MTYLFVIFFIFSSVLQIWYVVVRISQSVSEGPFDFEITRVDCNSKLYSVFCKRYFKTSVFEITRINYIHK